MFLLSWLAATLNGTSVIAVSVYNFEPNMMPFRNTFEAANQGCSTRVSNQISKKLFSNFMRALRIWVSMWQVLFGLIYTTRGKFHVNQSRCYMSGWRLRPKTLCHHNAWASKKIVIYLAIMWNITSTHNQMNPYFLAAKILTHCWWFDDASQLLGNI